MTNVPKTNLLEFIGIEETNLLVTMAKFHTDIVQVFPKLDGAYQAPLGFIDIKIDDAHKQTVMALYLFTHYHLYFSTVCLLRCHLSDSLGSTRKAIDATLTAYRLIEEPATLEQYHQQHRHYQAIKSYMDRARRHDATKYPLAGRLIELHDLCSEYGSHADISSFVHRITIAPTEEAGKGLFKVQMFQTPDTDLAHRAYLVETLLAYTEMAKVFSTFMGSVTTGFDVTAWNTQLGQLEKAFASEAHKIHAQIQAGQKTAAKTGDTTA